MTETKSKLTLLTTVVSKTYTENDVIIYFIIIYIIYHVTHAN